MGITKEAQEYLINVEKQRLKLLKGGGKGGRDDAAAFVEGQKAIGRQLSGDDNKFQSIAQNRLRNSAKKPKPDNLYDNPRGLPKRPVSGTTKKDDRPRWMQEPRVSKRDALTTTTGTAVKVAKRAVKSRFKQIGK